MIYYIDSRERFKNRKYFSTYKKSSDSENKNEKKIILYHITDLVEHIKKDEKILKNIKEEIKKNKILILFFTGEKIINRDDKDIIKREIRPCKKIGFLSGVPSELTSINYELLHKNIINVINDKESKKKEITIDWNDLINVNNMYNQISALINILVEIKEEIEKKNENDMNEIEKNLNKLIKSKDYWTPLKVLKENDVKVIKKKYKKIYNKIKDVIE